MSDAPSETKAMHEGKDQPLPFGVFALFTPDEAMPKDRGLYVKRRGGLALVAFAVIGLCWALGQSTWFVETIYAQGVGAFIGRALAKVTGLLPTSVAELLLVCAVLWLGVPALMALFHVLRRKRRFFNAAAVGTLRLLCFASVAIALFYVLWGINYFRAPLIEREGWQDFAHAPASRGEQLAELSILCKDLVDATNLAYFEAMDSMDAGQPSAPMADPAELDRQIDDGFARAQSDLGLPQGFGASRGRAKPVAASSLMPYLGISGFYFPWTAEANYDRYVPWCQQAHVIAHEKAHQRCIASEDEANFFGFAACARADDPYVRYSGYLFAQRQLLSELSTLDHERALQLVKQRYPGVQRDIDNARAWWAKYRQGVAAAVGEISSAVNDTYLKINNVEAGVQSYALSSRLLIACARKQGGLVAGAAGRK